MALWEVTIQGSSVCFIEGEDGEPVKCLEEDYHRFVKEGPDLIATMMVVQSKLDVLNEKLKPQHPEMYKDNIDWEYKIVGIVKTDMIQFNDRWIEEFVGQGVISRNYEEEESF